MSQVVIGDPERFDFRLCVFERRERIAPSNREIKHLSTKRSNCYEATEGPRLLHLENTGLAAANVSFPPSTVVRALRCLACYGLKPDLRHSAVSTVN